MSTTSIATIISIIASGVIAYLIARWQMKKNQIDHYFINSYDIGKGLTDDFPDFALHYGYEVLSNNVMVLQGGFMNTGRNDIGERDKKTEIKLVLPEGCAVKAVKVSPSVNGLKVCIEDSQRIEEKKRNDELCFEIDGVMKSKEWFNYIAIIETPNKKGNLFKQLSFDHRIKDTSLNNLYLGPEYKWRNNKKNNLKNSLYAICVIAMFLLWLGVQLFGDENLKNGSEAILIIAIGYAFLAIIENIHRRWGRKGRVVHELIKKQE